MQFACFNKWNEMSQKEMHQRYYFSIQVCT
jgi:hypothetical protein